MKTATILSIGAALAALPAIAVAQAPASPSATTGRTSASGAVSTAPAGAAMSDTTSAAVTGRTSASAATPQTAAASGKVAAGATVMDTKGGVVGTIESVNGDLAVLDTGANKVNLPLSSFAAGTSGPIIAMTKAEVDAAASGAAQQDQAALAAMLKPGAKVSDPHGGAVGTIEANDGALVTLATAKSKVKLPTSAFSKGASGVVVAMTAAEIEAAAKGAGGG